MRDSDSGLEKMAVGHHIHDRAHVIKKSKNNKTGDEEVNQEFINMNESELSQKPCPLSWTSSNSSPVDLDIFVEIFNTIHE